VALLLTILAVQAQSRNPAVPKLTDAEIAAIVVIANSADVENGELALTRAENPAVKAFARTMVTDHTAVNRQAAELVAMLGVTPAPSEASRSLAAATTAQRQSLAEKSGAAFDRAYIANEVAYHTTVLETLDGVLIPQAENGELKALLVAVRPAFVAHLEHARQLQESLES
jgi:putative membrane protein